MRFAFERMKMVIEPSGAAALAALLHDRIRRHRGEARRRNRQRRQHRPRSLCRVDRELAKLHRAARLEVTARDVLAEIGRAQVHVDRVRFRQQLIDRDALDGGGRTAADDVRQRVNDAAEIAAGAGVNVHRLRRPRRRAFDRDDDLQVGAHLGQRCGTAFAGLILLVQVQWSG